MAQRPSSAFRALTLLCSHSFAGRKGAILLVPEVMTFQSSLSQEPPFLFPKLKLCLPLPQYSWSSGFWRCRVLKKIQSISFLSFLLLHSLLTSSHSSFTQQHRPRAFIFYRKEHIAPGPVFSKKLQESLQPQTCRAAFVLRSSNWVKAAGVIGTVAAVTAGDCALCCITMKQHKLLWTELSALSCVPFYATWCTNCCAV